MIYEDSKNAYEFCQSGRDHWEKESNNILKWICEQTYPNKKLFYFWIILRFLKILEKQLKQFYKTSVKQRDK